MSTPEIMSDAMSGLSREQIQSALFAQLVIQQANLAMMLLGKIANPETGQTMRDIEAARLFIDQLEMLEAKTKGNLTREEEALLKQSLMSLRMAYVESVETPESPVPDKKEIQEPPADTSKPDAAMEESHKKFSKKY